MSLWNKYLAWQEKKAKKKKTSLEKALREADKAAEKEIREGRNNKGNPNKDGDLANG